MKSHYNEEKTMNEITLFMVKYKGERWRGVEVRMELLDRNATERLSFYVK